VETNGRRPAAVQAEGLVKHYSGRGGVVEAVRGVNLRIEPGEVFGFLGPNGAGKSTTMRLILGLDRPSRGVALVNGRAYADIHRPLFEVGAVLETGALHGGRSAFHHLLCLAQSNGIPTRRVGEVLDMVGLQDVARRRAGRFSLGMRQRLGLAAALLGDPPVLLCDEPVNGLDPEGILWIRTLLRRLAAEGRTVLVSSHLMSEMALTGDHLVVVGKGRLVADASVQEIIDRCSTSTVLVRSPMRAQLRVALVAAGADVLDHDDNGLTVSGMDAAAVGDVAAEHGIRVQELVNQQASLEAAFLELTHDSVDFRPGQVA
jgi:ABC-2 type transport system ATP-binding protein